MLNWWTDSIGEHCTVFVHLWSDMKGLSMSYSHMQVIAWLGSLSNEDVSEKKVEFIYIFCLTIFSSASERMQECHYGN